MLSDLQCLGKSLTHHIVILNCIESILACILFIHTYSPVCSDPAKRSSTQRLRYPRQSQGLLVSRRIFQQAASRQAKGFQPLQGALAADPGCRWSRHLQARLIRARVKPPINHPKSQEALPEAVSRDKSAFWCNAMIMHLLTFRRLDRTIRAMPQSSCADLWSCLAGFLPRVCHHKSCVGIMLCLALCRQYF